MTEENEKKPPIRTKHYERHQAIKHRKKMLEYKVGFFQREINRQTKKKKEREANFENRKARWKPKYASWDELNEAYIAGGMSDKEYDVQRKAIWIVYHDYDVPEKLAWLEEMQAPYKAELEALEEWMEDTKKKTAKELQKKYNREKARKKRKAKKRKERRQEEKEGAIRDAWLRAGYTYEGGKVKRIL